MRNALMSDVLLTAVFNGVPVKAATEATRVARIASFILLWMKEIKR